MLLEVQMCRAGLFRFVTENRTAGNLSAQPAAEDHDHRTGANDKKTIDKMTSAEIQQAYWSVNQMYSIQLVWPKPRIVLHESTRVKIPSCYDLRGREPKNTFFQ